LPGAASGADWRPCWLFDNRDWHSSAGDKHFGSRDRKTRCNGGIYAGSALGSSPAESDNIQPPIKEKPQSGRRTKRKKEERFPGEVSKKTQPKENGISNRRF